MAIDQQVEQKTVPDGFYQVIFDESTTSFIFRVRTHGAGEKVRPGQQVIALARRYGSRTFINFGIIQGGVVALQFVRWKDQAYNAAVLESAQIALGDTEKAGQCYARSFGRCYVCNRTLTDPHSLATGIGPDCAGTRQHKELWDSVSLTNSGEAATNE
jgi:hypothetical protein